MRLVVIFFVMFFAVPTIAALYEADSDFGPGTITVDDDTNLEWLDLTITSGIGIDEMPALLEEGQQFYGWRGPTELEFQEFLSNAGYEGANIFDIFPESDPEILQQAESFVRLLGTTNTSQDTYTVTEGMIMAPAERYTGMAIILYYDLSNLEPILESCRRIIPMASTTSPTVATFLVRLSLVPVEDLTWGTVKALYR